MDSYHPALKGKIDSFVRVDKNGEVESDAEWFDKDGHGTHTAGIICARPFQGMEGLAQEARLCSVAVSGMGKALLSLLVGMDLLLDCDIRIACMAVGVPRETPIFLRMMEAFQERDILVVAPSGNRGEGIVFSPGCYPQTLSVGAADENSRASKSSGSRTDENGRPWQPDIMASGVDVLSTIPYAQAAKKSGTSMACAYLTGVAAKLLIAKPEASSEDIKEALLNTTKSLAPGYGHRCRTGIVQMEAALDYLFTRKNNSFFLIDFQAPVFLKETYIDPRLENEYKRADPEEKLEAIIISKQSSVKKEFSQTKKLIRKATKKSGVKPETARFFKNADMAYIQAERLFYDKLLNDDNLFAAGAVNVNIFDMLMNS